MRPEEQDAEVTELNGHRATVPYPKNPVSWLPWYRYYRQLGFPVSEAVFTAWWVAQPWRRIVLVWWVARPWRAIYEASRDTWREYKQKNNSDGTGHGR